MKNNSKGKKLISLQEATKYCSYSQPYLRLRVRQGKLKAVKIENNWFTTKKWIEEYLQKIESFNGKRNSYFQKDIGKLKTEIERLKKEIKVLEPKKTFPTSPILVLKPALIAALVFILLCTGIVFGKDSIINFAEDVSENISENISKGANIAGEIVSEISVPKVSLPKVSLPKVSLPEISGSEISATVFDTFNILISEINMLSNRVGNKAADVSQSASQGIQTIPQTIIQGYTFADDFVEQKISLFGKNITERYLAADNFVEQKISLFGRQMTEGTKEVVEMVSQPFKKEIVIEKVAPVSGITEKEIETLKSQSKELKEKIEKLEREGITAKEIIKEVEVSRITRIEPVKEITKEKIITKIDDKELKKLKAQVAEFSLWGTDIEELRNITKKLQSRPTATYAASAPIYIASQGLQVGGTGTFASLGVSGSAGIGHLGVGGSTSLGSTSSDYLTVNATSAFKSAVTAEAGLTVGTSTLVIDSQGNISTTGNITTTGTGDLIISGDLTIAGAQVLSGASSFTTGTFSGDLTTAGNLIFDLAEDVTIQTTAPSVARIYTIPDFGDDDTFVGLAANQALTNKTYDGLSLTAETTGFTIAGGTTSKTLTIDADGTASNWNTAYTYSTVGHLPLVGGTLTGNIIFEGASVDEFETTLTVEDPTTPDKTLTLPNFTGYVVANVNKVTNIEGTGLSVTGGTLNFSSTGLTWAGNVIGLSVGGTGKNLTATNGGIVWSDTDSLEILAAGSSGQMLISGGAGTPSWTTTTIPSTAASGSILAANSANTLSAITSTSGTKVLTNTAGTITWETLSMTASSITETWAGSVQQAIDNLRQMTGQIRPISQVLEIIDTGSYSNIEASGNNYVLTAAATSGNVLTDVISSDSKLLLYFKSLELTVINGVGNTHATPVQVEIYGNADSYATALNGTTKFTIDPSSSLIELKRKDITEVATGANQTDWTMTAAGCFPSVAGDEYETILAQEIGVAAVLVVEKSVLGSFADTVVLEGGTDYTVDSSTRTATKITLSSSAASDITTSSKLRVTWVADVMKIDNSNINTSLKLKIYLNRNGVEATPEIQEVATGKYVEMLYEYTSKPMLTEKDILQHDIETLTMANVINDAMGAGVSADAIATQINTAIDEGVKTAAEIGDIFNTTNLTAANLNLICDSSNITSTNIKAVLDSGNVTVASQLGAMLEGTSLTAANAATVCNEKYTDAQKAAAFDNAIMSAARIAAVCNEAGFTAANKALVFNEAGFIAANKALVFNEAGFTAANKALVFNEAGFIAANKAGVCNHTNLTAAVLNAICDNANILSATIKAILDTGGVTVASQLGAMLEGAQLTAAHGGAVLNAKYSDAQKGAALANAIMSTARVASLLEIADLTAGVAGTICNAAEFTAANLNAACDHVNMSSARIKAILDTAGVTVASQLGAMLEGTQLTAANAATFCEAGTVNDDQLNAACDNAIMSSARIKAILDEGTVITAGHLGAMLEGTQLTAAHAATFCEAGTVNDDQLNAACDNAIMSSARIKAILDIGTVTTAGHLGAMLEGAQLTAANAANVCENKYTDAQKAAAFDNAIMTATKAASILDNTNLTADNTQSIMRTMSNYTKIIDIIVDDASDTTISSNTSVSNEVKRYGDLTINSSITLTLDAAHNRKVVIAKNVINNGTISKVNLANNAGGGLIIITKNWDNNNLVKADGEGTDSIGAAGAIARIGTDAVGTGGDGGNSYGPSGAAGNPNGGGGGGGAFGSDPTPGGSVSYTDYTAASLYQTFRNATIDWWLANVGTVKNPISPQSFPNIYGASGGDRGYHNADFYGGYGGSGGGEIIVLSDVFDNTGGTLRANGSNGGDGHTANCSYYAGGGGGGGSGLIYGLYRSTLTAAGILTASGGSGGNGNCCHVGGVGVAGTATTYSVSGG
ncbi:DUF4200 domain-containing protein [Candidatus Parcubacteria bacterium]|nr:DUF4200 domain-containing protein [Candidatus Parcubacteria bacterium]